MELSYASLLSWLSAARSEGVVARIHEVDAHSWHLSWIEREPNTPTGAGRRVLEALLELARAHRHQVTLDVSPQAPGLIRLYSQVGFQVQTQLPCGLIRMCWE